MPVYLHPGVYVEEIPSGAKPIDAVGTSTAAFVGFTTKGPIEEPLLISGFDQYQHHFGGIQNLSGVDTMGFSVAAFFLNGGTKAYIVRVAVAGSGGLTASSGSTGGMNFTAVNPGTWADNLVVRFTAATAGFTVDIGRYDDPADTGSNFNVLESFSDVSVTPGDARYVVNVVDDASEYVGVEVPGAILRVTGWWTTIRLVLVGPHRRLV